MGAFAQDIVSGDEVMSDTWRMKEVDGAVYEVDSRLVSKVIGGDVVGACCRNKGPSGVPDGEVQY